MKRTLLALSALSALAFAGVGFAQTAPAPNRAAAPAHAAMRGGPAAQRGPMQRFDPAKFAERRTERLRTLLQLRPEQEGALKAFVDATTPKGQGRMGDRMREGQGQRAEGQRLTTPQRLEQARKMMTERQARFDQISAATLRFYTQLSPSQQKVFDTQAHGMGGHRGGPGGGFRGHMGGGRGGPMGGQGGQHWGPQGGPMGGAQGGPPPR
jgi:protein CpxP